MGDSLNKRRVGSKYEQRAAQYLQQAGVCILEMNFNSRAGEVDIIGKDNDTYIFVEVKYRKTGSFGDPAQAVTYTKQRRICRVACFYKLYRHLNDNADIRFDVISMLGESITWYKNAFPYHI